MASIQLNIKPLSINEAFKGRKFRTPKYDKYIKDVLFLLPPLKVPNTDIKLFLEFGFSSRNSDIDNCCKNFIDCLVKKYGVDDRYINELHVYKTIVKKGSEFIIFKIE